MISNLKFQVVGFFFKIKGQNNNYRLDIVDCSNKKWFFQQVKLHLTKFKFNSLEGKIEKSNNKFQHSKMK
jgi:hypothetical protein